MSCSRIGVDDCTDYNETISFNKYGVSYLLRKAAEGPLDAVGTLPALRQLNRKRRAGVLAAPPFASEAQAVAGYRASLASDRVPLRKLLSTGIAAGASWQVGWAATLLSDLGWLTEDDTSSLLRIVESTAMNDQQVRISCE